MKVAFVFCLVSSVLASVLSAAELQTGYEELADGLRFTGAQWVETGYCHTERDRIECEITVDAAQTNASAAVFGTEYGGSRSFAFYVKTDGDDVATFTFGERASGAWFPRGVRTTLRLQPANAVWETSGGGSDALQLRGASPEVGLTPLVIGNVNAAAYPGDAEPGEAGIVMKLHGFKVWYGGLELLHDYVPCRENATGEVGLYDTVGREFLPRVGEPLPPVITSIEVSRTNDFALVGVRTVKGLTYELLRSPTVAPLSAYTNLVARAVANGPSLTLVDESRLKDRAFYRVEVKVEK